MMGHMHKQFAFC